METRDRIKMVRKDQKLSQTDFAAKMFMTKDAISNIERGINGPSDRTLELISQTFNVSKEWLETGEGEMYLLPLDEDAELFAELIREGSERATIESIKAVLRWYLSLPEADKDFLDEAIKKAVLATKKDPE